MSVAGTGVSPFLATSPQCVHRYWWTCVPALPTMRGSPADRALKRIWFDHTMNTFRVSADGAVRPNARGFYTEGTEDHVVPALFQTWAIFPEVASWMPELLALFGIKPIGACVARAGLISSSSRSRDVDFASPISCSLGKMMQVRPSWP